MIINDWKESSRIFSVINHGVRRERRENIKKVKLFCMFYLCGLSVLCGEMLMFFEPVKCEQSKVFEINFTVAIYVAGDNGFADGFSEV